MRITIIGTGRIGTSIGLGIRAADKDKAIEIRGHDKDRTHADRAQALGAVDKAYWNLMDSIDGADLVVLAMPIDGIQETLKLIGPVLRADCVVTDTARLKAPVLEWAKQYLPPAVHFVGGDPLVGPTPPGKPVKGPDASSATAFNGAPYYIVPSLRTAEAAVDLVTDMARMLGARPLFTDAAEHDGVSTAVNTLPSLVGAALLEVTTQAGNWRDLRLMAGQTLATATDIDSVTAWRDTLMLSQASVLPWLDAVIAELEHMRARLAKGDGDALAARLKAAQEERTAWIVKWEQGKWEDAGETPAPDVPGVGDSIARLFVGNLAERARNKGKRTDR